MFFLFQVEIIYIYTLMINNVLLNKVIYDNIFNPFII